MKRYFEYSEEDYYGLVVVETQGVEYYGDKADVIYHKHMGDCSIEVADAEYNPVEVSKEYSFWKFANCEGIEDMIIGEALEEFNSLEDTCLVIDGSLV